MSSPKLTTDESNSNVTAQGREQILDEYHVIHGPEDPLPTERSRTMLSAATETIRPRSNSNNMSATDDQCKQNSQKDKVSSDTTANSEVCHPKPTIICPRVDCPEKIIICLDLNEEMATTIFKSRSGDKYTGLELAKRSIRMFVMHKSQMNSRHEFALMIFHEESTMIQSFTNRAQDILNTLDESEIETQKSGPLNFAHLFGTIKDNIELPVVDGDPQILPPPYIVRVLLVFGRSQCVPVGLKSEVQQELESSPYFFNDVLYIHDPPSDDNKCEKIFTTLCDLDHNGLSYIFEQSKYTPILNSGAKLLAHPLQRPRQLDAMYKIGGPPQVSPATLPPPQLAQAAAAE